MTESTIMSSNRLKAKSTSAIRLRVAIMRERESHGETATTAHAARMGRRLPLIEGNERSAHAKTTRCDPKLTTLLVTPKRVCGKEFIRGQRA